MTVSSTARYESPSLSTDEDDGAAAAVDQRPDSTVSRRRGIGPTVGCLRPAESTLRAVGNGLGGY